MENEFVYTICCCYSLLDWVNSCVSTKVYLDLKNLSYFSTKIEVRKFIRILLLFSILPFCAAPHKKGVLMFKFETDQTEV